MNINPPQNFEKTFKPLKIYYNNERRWIIKAPSDYWALRQAIHSAFENDLPRYWTLQYSDTDGDRIVLANDDDYQGMIEDLLENSPTVKIYVLPVDKRSRRLSLENIRICTAPKADIPCHQQTPDDNEDILAQLKEEIPAQLILPDEEEKVGVKEEEGCSESYEKLVGNEEINVDVIQCSEEDSPISFSKVSESEEGKPKAEVKEISLESFSFEKSEKEGSLEQEQEKLSRQSSSSVEMETKKEEDVEKLLDLDIPMIECPKARGQDSSSFFSFNGEEENNRKEMKERAIHEGSVCKGCGINPIVGIRYNCPICKEFDYCEKCEKNIEHTHPFLKIKSENHNPKDIVSLIVAKNIVEAEGLSKEKKDELDPIINLLDEKLFGIKDLNEEEDVEEEKGELRVEKEKDLEEVKGGENPNNISFTENEIMCFKKKSEEPNVFCSSDISKSKIEMTKYPQKVHDLANEVMEIFPNADLDGLLDFIDRSPKMTLSDIIENFMLL